MRKSRKACMRAVTVADTVVEQDCDISHVLSRAVCRAHHDVVHYTHCGDVTAKDASIQKLSACNPFNLLNHKKTKNKKTKKKSPTRRMVVFILWETVVIRLTTTRSQHQSLRRTFAITIM
jgi:hypothetical protein